MEMPYIMCADIMRPYTDVAVAVQFYKLTVLMDDNKIKYEALLFMTRDIEVHPFPFIHIQGEAIKTRQSSL